MISAIELLDQKIANNKNIVDAANAEINVLMQFRDELVILGRDSETVLATSNEAASAINEMPLLKRLVRLATENCRKSQTRARRSSIVRFLFNNGPARRAKIMSILKNCKYDTLAFDLKELSMKNVIINTSDGWDCNRVL